MSTQGTITAVEVGRNLEVTTPATKISIAPLPAKDGATLMGRYVGVQFGNLSMSEDEQADMFVKALGSDLYEELQNTLRLPEMTPIAQIALYWQTVGIEGVEAFLADGPLAALKILLSQMGLSLSETSPGSASASQTLAQAVTANTGSPSGGKSAFSKD